MRTKITHCAFVRTVSGSRFAVYLDADGLAWELGERLFFINKYGCAYWESAKDPLEMCGDNEIIEALMRFCGVTRDLAKKNLEYCLALKKESLEHDGFDRMHDFTNVIFEGFHPPAKLTQRLFRKFVDLVVGPLDSAAGFYGQKCLRKITPLVYGGRDDVRFNSKDGFFEYIPMIQIEVAINTAARYEKSSHAGYMAQVSENLLPIHLQQKLALDCCYEPVILEFPLPRSDFHCRQCVN